MTAEVWDWKTQLTAGKTGEQLLSQLHGGLIDAPEACRAYDLLMVTGNLKVEVKTDSYDHTKTPNFFVEYACGTKPGGPWRAKQDEVDIFVHWFPNPTPKAYWFHDVPRLVDGLDTWLSSKKRWARVIKNKGWSAVGYVVPRAEVLTWCGDSVRVVEYQLP